MQVIVVGGHMLLLERVGCMKMGWTATEGGQVNAGEHERRTESNEEITPVG